MPTLARAKDGHYFVRHYHRGHTTWQIKSHGVLHLRRRGVEDGGTFLTDQFMDLWRIGWVYTGSQPERRPWPVVVGDQDVPQGLRDAIGDFYAAVRNNDSMAAWEFVSKPEPANAASESILFDRFRRSIIARPLYSWWRADVRTISPGFHWIATMVVKIGHTNESSFPFNLDESWAKTESGFCLLDERHRRAETLAELRAIRIQGSDDSPD